MDNFILDFLLSDIIMQTLSGGKRPGEVRRLKVKNLSSVTVLSQTVFFTENAGFHRMPGDNRLLTKLIRRSVKVTEDTQSI
ncbi:MAG: hypothetical protein A2Y92_04295 [Chloroflexi bacterium RBG_13_57_8]|nr:MAG: hypothetical protein A2Y92_04295 [Chloroflexi bacterium RBG_13_57_8]